MRRSLKDFIDKLDDNKELQDAKKYCKQSNLIKDYLKYKEKAVKEFWRYTICLYQVWSFYECYFDDAFILAHVLNITLTQRNKSQDYSPQMSGFQCDWLEEKAKILTNNGLIVYVVSQEINSDSNDENIYRSVDKILLPTKEGEVNGSFIWSLEYLWEEWRLSFIEVNDLRYYQHYTKTIDKESLSSLVYYYNIDELLVDERDIVALSKLNELKGVVDIKNVSILEKWLPPVISYIKKVYFGYDSVLLHSLEPIVIKEEGDRMNLSETTLQNLEVLKTKEGEIWSLFDCVNNTSTKMGKRYLYNMLSNPYKDIDDIKRIQTETKNLITLWVNNLMKIKSHMYWIEDLDKILAKIISWRILPKDVLELKSSVENFNNIEGIISENIDKTHSILSLPVFNEEARRNIKKYHFC